MYLVGFNIRIINEDVRTELQVYLLSTDVEGFGQRQEEHPLLLSDSRLSKMSQN